ncbi:MAG: hypothetical protein ABI840_04295 [bacterium]
MKLVNSKIIFPVWIIIFTLNFISCSKENKTESQGDKSRSSNKESEKTEVTDGDFNINYNLDGKLKGTMEIKKAGNKLKQSMNTEIMGTKNLTEVFILDNGVFVVTDVGGKKFGTKINGDDFKKKQTGETIIDYREFEKFLSDKKITGNENIIGYDCEIYDVGKGTTLSVYNKRYVLKISNPQFLATATKLDDKPAFSAGEFEVPSDIDFKSPGNQEVDKKYIDSMINKYKK